MTLSIFDVGKALRPTRRPQERDVSRGAVSQGRHVPGSPAGSEAGALTPGSPLGGASPGCWRSRTPLLAITDILSPLFVLCGACSAGQRPGPGRHSRGRASVYYPSWVPTTTVGTTGVSAVPDVGSAGCPASTSLGSSIKTSAKSSTESVTAPSSKVSTRLWTSSSGPSRSPTRRGAAYPATSPWVSSSCPRGAALPTARQPGPPAVPPPAARPLPTRNQGQGEGQGLRGPVAGLSSLTRRWS
jgi:hypothetical protein